jgi:DNA polymerase
MSIQRIALGPSADLPGFRQAVRRVAAAAIPPDTVVWTTVAPDLFGETEAGHAPPIALPRGLADLIDTVVCQQDPQRYALLYQAVWRVLHGEPK